MKLKQEWGFGYPGGENDTSVPTTFPSSDVLRATNWRITTDGTLEVRFGSKRTHPTARNSGGDCWGMTEFRPTGGATQIIAAWGNTLEYSTDGGATWTQIATGLREDYWSFASIVVTNGTSYLICVNGGNPAYRWDGTTWSTLTNWPTGVKYVETFNSRVWYAGHHKNHVNATAIADAVADLNTVAVPDGLVVPVHTHDGDSAILGIKEWRGLLLVGKRNSVSRIDGYGNATLVVGTGAKGETRAGGWVAFRCIVAAGDDVLYWLSERGIEEYRGGGTVKLASGKKRTFMRNIAWSYIFADGGVACGVYDPSREEIRFALPTSGARNTVQLILNVATGGITTHTAAVVGADGSFTMVNGDLGFTSSGAYQFGELVNGDLFLKPLGQPGLTPSLSDGDLVFSVVLSTDISAMLVADLTDETNAVLVGGFDGYLRRLDYGQLDDVLSDGSGGSQFLATLVGPPQSLDDKWARALQVWAVTDADADVELGVRTDGVETTRRSVTIPAAEASHPREKQVAVHGRGWIHEPWLECMTPGFRLAGIRLGSRRLPRQP